MARIICCLFVWTLLTIPAPAQESAPRFGWKTGAGYLYGVQQVTTTRQMLPFFEVSDQQPADQQPAELREVKSVSKLALSKRWDVVSVDGQGVATLHLTVPAIRMEIIAGDSDPIIYDSTRPTESDADLAKEMTKFVNGVLAEIRVDARGQLVEVKSSSFGPASRMEADLPFKVIWPETMPTGPWDRSFQIKLEPPHGAGESYDAIQKYTPKGQAESIATIGVTTELKEQPTVDEQIPLLPMLVEGEVFFDVANGRYQGAKLRVSKKLSAHRGEGSQYHYESSYVESLSKSW